MYTRSDLYISHFIKVPQNACELGQFTKNEVKSAIKNMQLQNMADVPTKHEKEHRMRRSSSVFLSTGNSNINKCS